MTEYEMADLLTNTTLAAVTSFSVYVSILAAYLVAAYLAGDKLTPMQITIVSTLYVVSAMLVTWSLYSYMSRAIPLADALEILNPDVNYGAQPFATNLLTIVMCLGIIACLKFMWDFRHPKE